MRPKKTTTPNDLPGLEPQEILNMNQRSWLWTCLIISFVVHMYVLVAGSIDSLIGLNVPVSVAPTEGLPSLVEEEAVVKEMDEREKSAEALAAAERAKATGTTGQANAGLSDIEKSRAGLSEAEIKASGAKSADDLIKEAPKEATGVRFDMKSLNELDSGL